MGRHLIIFVKNPELGKVKTRIATTTGDQQALAIYHQLLQVTQGNISDLKCNVHIYYSSFVDENDLFNHNNISKNVQIVGDLGEKMKSAFQDIFSQHNDLQNKPKVIIMGSDCPELSIEIINQAFSALENHATVIGPTFDGGYYCLGMDDFYPTLFEGVVWSTSDVFSQTIQNMDIQNLSYFKLPILHDIDHEEDWISYLSRQESNS